MVIYDDRGAEASEKILAQKPDGARLAAYTCSLAEQAYVTVRKIDDYTVYCDGHQLGLVTELSGRDRYYDISFRLELPDTENEYFLLADLGKTSGGLTAGYEALCIIDGEPYMGMSQYHSCIPLPRRREFEVIIRLWTGMRAVEGSELVHRISSISVSVRNRDVEKLAQHAACLLQALVSLDASDEMYEEYSTLLAAAAEQTDHKTALDIIRRGLAAMPVSKRRRIYAVGHTHIDLAWHWRFKHTREKAVRSFSTAVRLMERYPYYKFVQSQPWLYEQVRNDCPKLFEEICRRIAAGQWEAEGCMYVEADNNLPSGESLIRQLLVGRKVMSGFGGDMETLWLPDVFGYNSQMPQILTKSGVKQFLTSKISWNDTNKMPFDCFMWEGIDGSRILTQFLSTPDLSMEDDGRYATYNGRIDYASIDGTERRYSSDAADAQIMLYGYGDGGGGVTEDMLRKLPVFMEFHALPELVYSNSREFFTAIRKNVREACLPVWDRELYLEYHRGTYTTAGRIKRWNRKLEYLYKQTEILAFALGVMGCGAKLEPGWKNILLNQAHDVLPGTSINEVYEDAEALYRNSLDLAASVQQQLLSGLPVDDAWTVFSTIPHRHEQYVRINAEGGLRFFHGECELRSQKTDFGYYVLVPFDGVQFRRIRAERCETGVLYSKNREFATSRYEVRFNDHGQIERLYDKVQQRELAACLLNRLVAYDDKPSEYEAWNLDADYIDHPHPIENMTEYRLIEGELATTVQTALRFGETVIRQTINFFDNGLIEFDTTADWQECQKVLKAEFDFNLSSEFVTYDIQFGSIRRSTVPKDSFDKAKFEVVGHKFADISGKEWGMALLNDCKYGYSHTRSGLRLTLLRSTNYPAEKIDRGEHRFKYALYPHTGSFDASDVCLEAEVFNEPAMVFRGYGMESGSLMEVSDRGLSLSCIKDSEDGTCSVIRLNENRGEGGKFSIGFGRLVDFEETDLMERVTAGKKSADSIECTFSKYEIKTFRIKKRADNEEK